MLTLKEMQSLPEEDQAKLFNKIVGERKKAKPVNYGATYGQGPEGLARETGMPLSQAKELNEVYWQRNWSVKVIAEEQVVRTFSGQKWLKNPLSGFYYSLRSDKDRFSTLNQGSGVFCFDNWVMEVKKKGVPIVGQMHDEIVCLIKKGKRDKCEAALKDAIVKVNQRINMNRELDISVDFGDNYAEIH